MTSHGSRRSPSPSRWPPPRAAPPATTESADRRPRTTEADDLEQRDDRLRRRPSRRSTTTPRPGPRRSISASTSSPTAGSPRPHEDSGEPDLFTTCSEFDLEDLSLAEHYTEDFSTGDLGADDGQQITVGTRVFEDEDTASSLLDVMPEDEFIACANDELQSDLRRRLRRAARSRPGSSSASVTRPRASRASARGRPRTARRGLPADRLRRHPHR